MMSRMLRKPIGIMKQKVSSILSQNSESQNDDKKQVPAKFMVYSAHDTQIVNMMAFLQKDFYYTPFSSNVIFELKYSQQCLASDDASEACFSVSVAFDGSP